MALTGVVTWVAIGLGLGWLARVLMPDGGRTLAWDLALGLASAAAASVSAWIVGATAHAPAAALAVAAFVGAVGVIVGQRTLWPGPFVVLTKVRCGRRP